MMDLRELREKYFNLQPGQLMLIALALLAVEALLLYSFLLQPRLQARAQLMAEIRSNRGTLENQAPKMDSLRLSPPGVIKDVIDPEQLEFVEQNGNKLISVAQLEGYLALLKDVTEKSGGRNVEIQEGVSDSAHIRAGQRRETYSVSKMPVSITFDSSYAAASNFLFQLKSMNHMMVVTQVNFTNRDFRGNIHMDVSLDVYYTDTPRETEPPGET